MKLSLVSKLSLVVSALFVAAACNDGQNGHSGSDGKDGKGGAAGEGPALNPSGESLSLVTPSKGLLDREVEVSIGGSGTKFDENAKPDFGPGIEVVEVTSSSTALITAKIRIAKDAAIGPRTVTIGDLKAEKAFTVAPAINVVNSGKPGAEVPQGGLVQFTIENNDTRAFDSNAFQLEAADLIDIGSQASGPQSATGFLLAPPLAKTGKAQISVANLGPDGKPSVSFLSAVDALGVTARTSVSFALDTASEEAFVSSTDAKLFKLTSPATEAAFVDYHVEVAADGTAVPVAFVFGTGGGKDDRVGQVTPPRNPLSGQYNPAPYDLHVALPIAAGATATDHYVVLANLGSKADATAKITATRTAAEVTNEATDPHAQNAPQSVSAITSTKGQVVSAELKLDGEVDVYKLTADAASKLQVAVTTDGADLEIVLTKNPNVLEDPQGTTAANKKVLGYLYPGKGFASQRITAAALTEIYAVVHFDAEQGVVKTGKYTLGLRKAP